MGKRIINLKLEFINESNNIIKEEEKKDNLELEFINEFINIIKEEEKKEKDNKTKNPNIGSDIETTTKSVLNIIEKYKGKKLTDINNESDEIKKLIQNNNLDSIKRSLNIIKKELSIEIINEKIDNLEKPKWNFPLIGSVIFVFFVLICYIGIFLFYHFFMRDMDKDIKFSYFILLIIISISMQVIGLIGTLTFTKYLKEKYQKELDFYHSKLNYLENKKRQFYSFN